MKNGRKQYLEAGMITNTHGIRGAVKIQPWTDTPDVLCGIERFYIDGKEIRVLGSSVHKSAVICTLEGVEDINTANTFRGKTIYVNRDDLEIEEGRYFIQDLIGLRVIDSNLGDIGTIVDVLTLPANDVYIVHGEKKYMIPAVPEFVKRIDLDAGRAEVEIIEGMEG
ncbi:MAG: 16S rRNA processing protein RimM [Clostridiales bacterium]|nr:16S rRNA processing protein RimM [Clostridiales bacterium]